MNTSAKSFHKSFSHGLREKGFFMEQNHSSRPLISVLIPVYNAGKYLAETLASIKNQTYSNLEIICIDDGSTDKSLAILQEFAQKDPRFKIISRTNKGVANTRNQLLQESKGEYIAFVDSDDIIEPIYIEHLLNCALNKQADVVRCLYWFNEKGINIPCEKRCKEFLKSEPISLSERIQAALDDSQVWLKLIKTELIRNAKLNFLPNTIAEDQGFEFLLYLSAKNIVFLKEHLYHYRVLEGSVSSNKRKLAYGTLQQMVYLCGELARRGFKGPVVYNPIIRLTVQAVRRLRKYPNVDFTLARRALQEVALHLPNCSLYPRLKYQFLCKLAGCVEDKNLPKLGWWIR
ncbi:glycosyltransferase family 2 protein [Candidatus Avelusimicrobium fimicolum]|uniref:glycosyltransferase family 2 protein n=1 Tax=Candidatus Avelusimicrobium fimicolum TaxID=3416216 RepID=UPI003D0AA86E